MALVRFADPRHHRRVVGAGVEFVRTVEGIDMTTIPEMCMAYTEVFRTLKIELTFMLVIGVGIGYWVRRLEE